MKYINTDKMDIFMKSQNDTSFVKNAIIQWFIIVIVIINALNFIGLAIFMDKSVLFIKLQYNVYFGTNLFARYWWEPYLIPVMGLLFFVINIFLSYMLYSMRERLLAYGLFIGTLFVQIAMSVAVISIILNNF